MNLENQGVRQSPLRGYRRRKTLLDLNASPKTLVDLNVSPSETPAGEGMPSEVTASQVCAASQQHAQPETPLTIDVEAIDDDDVLVSSPRSFEEAKNNARRAYGRPVVVDLDSGYSTHLNQYRQSKRRRASPSQTIINCDLYINLEGSSSSSSKRDTIQHQSLQPPPPKEPIFSCPICMSPFVEETSTKCGHIFCKACLKSAIAVQPKCPTCRKKVVAKDLIRVFLPATSSLH